MKESIEQFLARGGKIERGEYSTFEASGEVPPPGGLRTVISNGRALAFLRRQAGIASGAARREKARLRGLN